MQLPHHGVDCFRLEELVEGHVLQHVAQQSAVHGELVELCFRPGRVSLIHENAYELGEQALGDRRGRKGRVAHHRDTAFLDAPEYLLQMGEVHHILQTVAVGLDQDGKVWEAPDGLQELSGTQALQPEGGALARPGPRQQERPGGILPEPRPEDGGVGDLAQDPFARLHGWHANRHVYREIGVHLREAQENAVIVALHFWGDPQALAQGIADGQTPRPIDATPEGGVDHDARITQPVAEGLDHDAAVGRDSAGGMKLAGDVTHHAAR